ncbi:MAG: cytochrome P450 [Pseudomonadota bacterium]
MSIARPPGPHSPYFGLGLLRQMQRDYLGFWHKAQQAHGDTVYILVAGRDTYSFMHPDQIREVLVDKASSFIRYQRHMRVLSELHGQSVLITEGDTWRKQRRTLQPGFSPKRYDGYARQMGESASRVLDQLPCSANEAIDFEHAMNMLAMDVILSTMFSAAPPSDTADIEKAVSLLSRTAYEEMFYPASLPDWLPLPSKRAKRKAMKLLDDLIWSHIKARRNSGQVHDDLLGMLLTATDSEGDASLLSDQQVRDQLMTAFLAGHETTASGLTWAGWVLASHPDIAQRAAHEVDQVLQGRTPGFADLAQLPFVGQVIKETLRLYSPATGVFMRRAVEDVQIGEWMVPSGALVSILSTIPQRDARWFPDPDRFDPERFAPEASKRIPRGAYFPFGTGPRVCIGNSFATMEMTMILAMLLQRRVLRPAPGQRQPGMRMQVTMRPEGGMRLILDKREALAVGIPPAQSAPAGCPFHA